MCRRLDNLLNTCQPPMKSGFKLRSIVFDDGAPGAIPTRDLSLRRRALYATELREHNKVNSKS
jgi:hypothetical protein